MKSRASLFLTVLLLALSLTACGKEPAKNDRNDAGSGHGRVHDRDGDLLDGENSVTPGTDRW